MPESQVSNDPGSMPFLVGSTFHERYEVVRCLSTGGMGAVYEAIHKETRRHCALKVMLASLVRDEELRARFKLECTVASNVESEHIVQVFDAGVDAATGLPFLVMELLRGEDLFSLSERRGALPAEEVVTYVYQAALALERTHAAGIVHRDLKPENLFVTTRDDGTPRLKILDFGIARVVAREDRITKSFMGSPLYMAPEQLTVEADVCPATDNYALAQVAFTMLTGTEYFSLEQREEAGLFKLASKIGRGVPEPATVRAQRYGRTLPSAFDAWFQKATALDPKDRFRRAQNLAGALAEALGVMAPGPLPRDDHERSLGSISAAPPSAAPSIVPVRSSEAVTVAKPTFSRVQQLGILALLALAGLGVGIVVSVTRAPASAGSAVPRSATEPGPSATPVALRLAASSATVGDAPGEAPSGSAPSAVASAGHSGSRPPSTPAPSRPPTKPKKTHVSTDPLDMR